MTVDELADAIEYKLYKSECIGAMADKDMELLAAILARFIINEMTPSDKSTARGDA